MNYFFIFVHKFDFMNNNCSLQKYIIATTLLITLVCSLPFVDIISTLRTMNTDYPTPLEKKIANEFVALLDDGPTPLEKKIANEFIALLDDEPTPLEKKIANEFVALLDGPQIKESITFMNGKTLQIDLGKIIYT